MATMGMYCKAYPVGRFREFPAWREKAENARPEKQEADGRGVEAPRTLANEDCLYLQENFAVTDGIYIDQYVIFDEVTPEWEEFCKTSLQFEVPAMG
jgi:hypothetical protein